MNKIKLKVKPEDFIVEESADLLLKKNGEYGFYSLTKKSWNTVDSIYKLSCKFKIPVKNISYGGRKDRHALTTQTISIKSNRILEHKDANMSLEFIGFMDRPMAPSLIKNNKFKITVRNLKPLEAENSLEKIKILQSEGFANYFDDQRFGIFTPNKEFPAEKILKKQYNGALRIYLTCISKEDNIKEKEKRTFFSDNWKNWPECLKRSDNFFEKKAFDFLSKYSTGFLPVLQMISADEMRFLFSSYQSFLWNEILRRIISSSGSFESYKGVAGNYLFFKALQHDQLRYLQKLNLPTPASKTKMEDDFSGSVYNEVLKDNNITPSSFNLRQIRQAYFKAIDRSAVVFPDNLSSSLENDEIYSKKQKLILNFTLPRGSFGTMLVKRIFAEKEVTKEN